MRIVLSLAALLLATAAAPAPRVIPSDDPSEFVANQPANGRDRIETVRDERGLPKLDRENAAPDQPLFIAAVDRRIDGCAVMVMYNNTSDVRSLPERPAGPPRLQRIPGQ
jgi:hypothetical protein